VVTSTTIGAKPVSLLGIVTTLLATRIGITALAYLFIKIKIYYTLFSLPLGKNKSQLD
jgi:hypothetical protein